MNTTEGTSATAVGGSALSEGLGPLYAERDYMAQGTYYTRHVSAMTGEGLHAKSAIAAELAHRDMEIEKLRDLARRALPMADALDATKTAVVWTGDLQVGATMLARDIRAALRA